MSPTSSQHVLKGPPVSSVRTPKGWQGGRAFCVLARSTSGATSVIACRSKVKPGRVISHQHGVTAVSISNRFSGLPVWLRARKFLELHSMWIPVMSFLPLPWFQALLQQVTEIRPVAVRNSAPLYGILIQAISTTMARGAMVHPFGTSPYIGPGHNLATLIPSSSYLTGGMRRR